MTSRAVDALQADRDALVVIGAALDDEQWQARSGWAGWTVQGLVTHLAGGFWRVVDRSVLPDIGGLTTAQGQDAIVASRQDWSAERVLDDYASVSTRAIERFVALEGSDTVISFGDLGRHPASMVPNSFAFDHYTHIRSDLCRPGGPLAVEPPPCDELRLEPALDWVASALAQQNQARVEALAGSLVIDVTGPGARTLVVGQGPEVARVEGDGDTVIRWVTQRQPWSDLDLVATGEAATLDLVGQLSVS